MNPNSQPPSPLPGWLPDQALSGQWLGAGGSSGLPLSDTEDEGAFVNMDEEWEYGSDQELSQWGGLSGQELCLWEEMTVQEFYQRQEAATIQEVSPWGVVTHQELHQREVGVKVPWGDGTEQELYYWDESVTVQELYPWEEEDELCQDLSQWEEDLTCQELSQWEGEELSPLEEDVQGHLHMYQWEGDKRHPELPQVQDNKDKDLSQGKDYNVRELPQWEKDTSDQIGRAHV